MEYEFLILDKQHPDSGKRIFLEGERLTCDEAAKKLIKALYPKLNPVEIDLKLRSSTEEFDTTRSLFSYKLRSDVRECSLIYSCLGNIPKPIFRSLLALRASWVSISFCRFRLPLCIL